MEVLLVNVGKNIGNVGQNIGNAALKVYEYIVRLLTPKERLYFNDAIKNIEDNL